MFLSRTLSKIALLIAAIAICFAPSSALAQPADDQTISASGVGDALLGMTADELADALGPQFDISDEVRITVDFDGRVISRGGDVQFRAAKTEGDERLTLFIVSNPDYATAEGVGPTTTIADAEAIYGEATLNWNPDNEGREFVSFDNGPDGRVFFRTPGIGGTNVGEYADGEFETTEYDPDGEIAAVWVSCVSGDCAASGATEEPTAEPTTEPTATPTPTAEAEEEEEEEEPTPTPTATATPTPTPTAAEPTATPTPSSSGGTDSGGTSGGSTDSGQLPRTGATELVLLSAGALLFSLGGAFALVERRYLCPAWLRRS